MGIDFVGIESADLIAYGRSTKIQKAKQIWMTKPSHVLNNAFES